MSGAVTASRLFDGLSDAQVAGLVGCLDHRRVAAGTVLMAEGDRPRELYVIASGTADVTATGHDRRPALLNRLGPGAVVGELSVLTGRPASATVRASSDLTVLAI